jgi:hypothetical protein
MPQPAGGLGLHQLATALGVPDAAVRRAVELELVAPPDHGGGRWSIRAVARIRDQWPRVAEAIQAARELGAARCAELLSRLTGLPVAPADVAELAEQGALASSRTFKQRPLYRVADVEALAANPAHLALLAGIVAARPA